MSILHINSTRATFRSDLDLHQARLRLACICTTKDKTTQLNYLIQFSKCGLQYIGETENRLHIKMNGHRSDINTRKTEKPVAAHFNQPDHSLDDLQVMGIEKIHTNNARWRKQRKSLYFHP